MHCFFGLKPVISISDLMKTVKAKSSKYINDHSLTSERFEWQEGYGVFSYSQSQVDRVLNIFRTRKHIIKNKPFGKSIWSFYRSSTLPMRSSMYFMNLCRDAPSLRLSAMSGLLYNGLKSVVTKCTEPTALDGRRIRSVLLYHQTYR